MSRLRKILPSPLSSSKKFLSETSYANEPYISAMFKLGEYYEGETKPIVNCLKDAGIKVEQKVCLYSMPKVSEYLEGRLSELRSEIKDIEKYERYLEALRLALAKFTPQEDLKDLFYCELDPAWAEKKRKADDILKIPISSLPEEEKEAAKKNLMDVFAEIDVKDIMEKSKAFDFAITTLARNEIEQGQDLGDRLSDPIVRIEVDEEEYKDHKLLKRTFFVDFEKIYELYIDEFSAPLYDELDEDFQDGYSEEFFMIKALGILMKSLVEEPFQGKIDMDAFAERCDLLLESDGDLLDIDATDVAEDIARVLEKNGLIKIKGDKIKWKA